MNLSDLTKIALSDIADYKRNRFKPGTHYLDMNSLYKMAVDVSNGPIPGMEDAPKDPEDPITKIKDVDKKVKPKVEPKIDPKADPKSTWWTKTKAVGRGVSGAAFPLMMGYDMIKGVPTPPPMYQGVNQGLAKGTMKKI